MPRLRGCTALLASAVVLTAIAAGPAQAVKVTTFPLSGPTFITTMAFGSDGRIWTIGVEGQNVVRATDVSSGVVSEYPLGGFPRLAGAGALASAPGGELWLTSFDEPSGLGRLTTSGGVTDLSSQIAVDSGPNSIAAGADGTIWFSTANPPGIARRLQDGATTYATTGVSDAMGILDLITDADGNAWYGDRNGTVGRVDVATLDVAEFSGGIAPGSDLFDLELAADGSIWFSNSAQQTLGRVLADGSITQFPVGRGPKHIAVSPDGTVYFSDSDGLGRRTAGGEVSYLPLCGGFDNESLDELDLGPTGDLYGLADAGLQAYLLRFSDLGRWDTMECASFVPVPPDPPSPSEPTPPPNPAGPSLGSQPCLGLASAAGTASSISHPVRLGRGALVRLKGPRRGLVVQTEAKGYAFQFKMKGKAAKRVRSAAFALDGKPHLTVRPSKSFTIPFKRRELQALPLGRHDMTVALKLRRAVKVKGKKGKRRALKIVSSFVVRRCAPPSMAVVQGRKRLTRPTGIAMRAAGGGPALASAAFRVGSALKFTRKAKQWKRKVIGSLTLRSGSRTAFKAKLRAPRKVRKTLAFTMANGTVVRWRGRSITVSGLPANISGVWLRLNGTAKVRPFINPRRKASTTHSVRLTDRGNVTVKVNRSTRISAKPGSAK